MQTTAYALLPTENRHDGKDFEYWGADAASFIKTFPNFTSFPHRRAYIDYKSVGHANVGGLPARLQAVHHGGALRGLGTGAGPGPAEPVSYQCLAVDLRRQRVGRAPDDETYFRAFHPLLARVLPGGFRIGAQCHS